MAVPPPSPALLVAALAALAVGPFADRLTRGRPGLRVGLDGALTGLLVGLVALHVLPEAYRVVGLASLAAAALGLFGPGLLNRLVGTGVGTRAAIVAGGVGLGVHAFLDGIALGAPSLHPHAAVSAIGLAVVVHRLPVGLLVWGLVRSRRGPAAAALALTAIGGTTVLGYVVGHEAGAEAHVRGLALFQSLVGGTLLHLVREESPFAPAPAPTSCCAPRPPAWGGPRGEALGFLVGLAAGILLPGLHPHASGWDALGQRFLDLVLASAPALVLGFALAGAVAAFLPGAPLAWASRGSRAIQALKGMGFGLPLPICSCGVVPVYRGLVARGLPGPAAIAFLVATPELGVESVLLTVPLLGAPFTVARVAAAAVLAIGAGLLVGRLARGGTEPGAESAIPPLLGTARGGSRIRRAFRYGFVDVVDDVAAWLLVGLALAALFEPSTVGPLLDRVPEYLHVPLAAALGIPLYVCASGATPVAAALVAAGLSPGAGLAFLLSGPSTNVTTFGVLERLHGRGTAVAFAATMIAGSTLLGWVTNLVLPSAVEGTRLADAAAPGPVAWAAAIILLVLFLGTLFRKGPRGLARDVM